jgi:PAS domain S-box-containing protein
MTAEEELELLRQRMDNAQQLANMGDYDWHIPTDTNRWSDQLYRIYGHEPQAFEMTYERFLSFVHPEDREMIQGIHQQSYATGEPYEMIERIVRPDGEVRYLHSNGQVVMSADGAPERMRGTCIDVTDQVLADREREATAMQLHAQQLRRRQAVEINDNIVQGLTAAMYALELGETESCRSYLDATLAAARSMMEPDADLVRSEAASLDGMPD